jgi:hypothetical protein
MSNRPFGAAMDPASIAPRIGSSYPKQYRQQVELRRKRVR